MTQKDIVEQHDPLLVNGLTRLLSVPGQRPRFQLVLEDI